MNAQQDGWETLRWVVFVRDRWCIATRTDLFGAGVAPDVCRGKFGDVLETWDFAKLEFDHVKERSATAKRASDDEAHGVAACPWHHRLSREWRTDTAAHRAVIRDYLREKYPEVWEDHESA